MENIKDNVKVLSKNKSNDKDEKDLKLFTCSRCNKTVTFDINDSSTYICKVCGLQFTYMFKCENEEDSGKVRVDGSDKLIKTVPVVAEYNMAPDKPFPNVLPNKEDDLSIFQISPNGYIISKDIDSHGFDESIENPLTKIEFKNQEFNGDDGISINSLLTVVKDRISCTMDGRIKNQLNLLIDSMQNMITDHINKQLF